MPMTITLYELSNYNSGNLVCRTFNLGCGEIETHDEYKAAIQEWLKELSAEGDETYEEWIVADAEGVPDKYVGEYSLDKEFFDFLDAVKEHGDHRLVEAAVECEVPLNLIESAYIGQYDSDEDMAREEFTQLQSIPAEVLEFIDWEAVTRSQMVRSSTHGGYYFKIV